MAIDEANQEQAELWHTSGPMWVALRDRFDAQSGAHGTAAMDALDPQPGERLYDIGCGPGSTSVELARRVGADGAVVGLDISETMIEGARAHAAELGFDGVSFRVGDAMIEPFAGDADAVFSRFGVMFFSDASAGFTNIRTALRPGGRLGFACWQAPATNPWITESFAVAANHIELPFGQDPTAPGPFSLADPERVTQVLTDAGFADVTITAFEASSVLGPDEASAAEFMAKLLPGSGSYPKETADALLEDLQVAYARWLSPRGVEFSSASWTVTASNP